MPFHSAYLGQLLVWFGVTDSPRSSFISLSIIENKILSILKSVHLLILWFKFYFLDLIVYDVAVCVRFVKFNIDYFVLNCEDYCS